MVSKKAALATLSPNPQAFNLSALNPYDVRPVPALRLKEAIFAGSILGNGV